ncbi:Uncharacterised protein [Salmonella enterica]|nr:hypothetical protein [Salmonella enterica subsp. enterica serovar Richmond]ECB5086660.1 hypothetical protein [Salmonella enterica subsp. enterica serovar Hvittingfoss]ECB7316923.1 hypothetical protein [Salmonella enterica subsp. enterica serovar Treforest]ECW7885010.1 hypothetical protein [Salmonella enterica subsp. enterica serovar Chester]EDE9371104.1 hypothetical protein [Salmonella enterica subsp. enterica serovar Typhimurium]EDR5814952.1 hypothetical protein [Salmonella enterica subsp.
MKYDDASWHDTEEFPTDQPYEHTGTHIALYLKWCFIRGWASELHMEYEPEAVAGVISGTLSATEFLFEYCDGKFTDEDLTDAGNMFTEKHYNDYLNDYVEYIGDLAYLVPESAHDFEQLSEILDARAKMFENE